MISQHRSSAIDDNACAGVSASVWRYLASIRESPLLLRLYETTE